MKILIRVVLILVLLFVLGLFGLNWFLEKGLTPAIQKALPTVEQKLGVPVEVGGASISLLAGSMTVENVRVGNPEGFQQPDLFSLSRSVQDIALWPLISKRELRVEEVSIENSDLTVVRNTEGAINVKTILANLQKDAPPPEEEPAEEDAPPAEKGPLPPVKLEHLLVTSLLSYVQEKESGDPFNLGLDLKVSGSDIGTIGEPTDRGTISIRGNLAGNQKLFVINVDGKIAPVTDPLAPTFEITGQVDSVELRMFEIFRKEFKLDGGMMGLDMVLHAKDGLFDGEKSVVRVLINQPELGSGLGIPAGFQPALIAFPVRVSGTVQKPEINFMKGLREGIQDALMGTAAGKKFKEQAAQAKAQVEAAAAEAKREAAKATESLKQGKTPDLKGIIPSFGEGSDKEDSGDSAEEGKKKESGLGGLIPGF